MAAFSSRRDEAEFHFAPPGEHAQLAQKLATSHLASLAQLCASVKRRHIRLARVKQATSKAAAGWIARPTRPAVGVFALVSSLLDNVPGNVVD